MDENVLIDVYQLIDSLGMGVECIKRYDDYANHAFNPISVNEIEHIIGVLKRCAEAIKDKDA